MSSHQQPTAEQILAGMRQAMGKAPSAMKKSVSANPDSSTNTCVPAPSPCRRKAFWTRKPAP